MYVNPEAVRKSTEQHDSRDGMITPGNSESRVATIPNLVTAVRIACIPVFIWMTVFAHMLVAGAILLGVLGATDWVDGQLARRLNQVSNLGKFIDPTADRLLVASGVVAAILTHAVPVWLVVVVLLREVLVSLAVLLLMLIGAKRIDVLFVGKAGTFAIMVAFPAFLISHGHAAWQTPFHIIAWVATSAGLALGWAAVLAYIPAAKHALASRNNPIHPETIPSKEV